MNLVLKVHLSIDEYLTEVILTGVNTAIFSPSGANTGVGFAIPVDVVKSSVQQIIQFGKVVRPILGIQFAPDQSEQASPLLGPSSFSTELLVDASGHDPWITACYWHL